MKKYFEQQLISSILNVFVIIYIKNLSTNGVFLKIDL